MLAAGRDTLGRVGSVLAHRRAHETWACLLALVTAIVWSARPVSGAEGTISADFVRIVVAGASCDTIRGAVYCDTRVSRAVVDVWRPVRQRIIVTDSSAVVCYPDKARAFRFRGSGYAYLPFLSIFLAGASRTLGIEQMGFVMDRYQVRADTLVTHWRPRETGRAPVGAATIAYQGDRLVLMRVVDSQGAVVLEVHCSHHIPHGDGFYPLQLAILQYGPTGNTREEVRYSSLRFGLELPQDVAHLRLPPGTEVEEVEW